MTRYFMLTILAFCASLAWAQQKKNKPSYNPGLEQTVPGQSQPEFWKIWGSGYLVESDAEVKHEGNLAVRIEPLTEDRNFGGLGLTLPTMPKGKTVEVSGWIKTRNAEDGYAGLVLRLKNASGDVIEFDNMKDRGITGTTQWTRYSVQLPCPEETTEIAIGAIFTGTGTMWVDDFEVRMNGRVLYRPK